MHGGPDPVSFRVRIATTRSLLRCRETASRSGCARRSPGRVDRRRTFRGAREAGRRSRRIIPAPRESRCDAIRPPQRSSTCRGQPALPLSDVRPDLTGGGHKGRVLRGPRRSTLSAGSRNSPRATRRRLPDSVRVRRVRAEAEYSGDRNGYACSSACDRSGAYRHVGVDDARRRGRRPRAHASGDRLVIRRDAPTDEKLFSSPCSQQG